VQVDGRNVDNSGLVRLPLAESSGGHRISGSILVSLPAPAPGGTLTPVRPGLNRINFAGSYKSRIEVDATWSHPAGPGSVSAESSFTQRNGPLNEPGLSTCTAAVPTITVNQPAIAGTRPLSLGCLYGWRDERWGLRHVYDVDTE
jgi:hypothetical protein